MRVVQSSLLLASLAFSIPASALTVDSSFSGSLTQNGRIFRDGIPSGCPSKVYPGPFNVGTTYNYEAFTLVNPGAETCVTVNFNPDTSGSTPCGTNAHASAYLGSYDPTNQATNFLGDVGSSITQPFSFTAPAGATIVIVVTNTSSASTCSFGFSTSELVLAGASLDFGDAPSAYPTLLTDDGARHTPGGPSLGSSPDTEADGQPSFNSLGDDNAGVDDEDGFQPPSLLEIGWSNNANLIVQGSGGVVDAWFDFNRDGDWSDPGEKAIDGLAVSVGTTQVSISTPADAVEGASVARVRITSAGIASPTGAAGDGEVEDHDIAIFLRRDYGDAPFPYPTTDADNGARHALYPDGPFLGGAPDRENDGQPTSSANGDDNTGDDDEDGITIDDDFESGEDSNILVEVSNGPAVLDAWIDLNQDGDWNDANEKFISGQTVVDGTNTINVEIPEDVGEGSTYARFRLSSTGSDFPTGEVADGEVEDYFVTVDDEEFRPPSGGGGGGLEPNGEVPLPAGTGGSLPASLVILFGAAAILRRRRI